MTITQALFAPLVVVVGATGNQGGSVVKALEESDKPYRIRIFTRDATKPTAQALLKKGIEVVAISLVVENAKKVNEAFVGANMAFLMTNFWEHLDMQREISEGKMLIDAAKASGAERVVWSGLPSMSKVTAGKYVNVYHFDSKAAVADYGRKSGVPLVDVQAGSYASAFVDNPIVLGKLDDGSFAVEWPMAPTTVLPVIDTAHDYGLFVRRVFELPVFPVGSEVRTSGDNIMIKDIVKELSRVTGKKVVFKQVSTEQFGSKIQALGFPHHIAVDLNDFFSAANEFGYYGPEATASLEGLARKPRTWAEFVQTADWSKVLV